MSILPSPDQVKTLRFGFAEGGEIDDNGGQTPTVFPERIWRAWGTFEPLTFKNPAHRRELLAVAPRWLYSTAGTDDLREFLDAARFDPLTGTLAVRIDSDLGEPLGVKRRRARIRNETVKWAACKGCRIGHQSYVRLHDYARRVFILEGWHDTLNGILLGLDFIGLQSASKRQWSSFELAILAGSEVVFIPDRDEAGVTCARRLARDLIARGHPAHVRIVDIGADDFSEWIEGFDSFERFRRGWEQKFGFGNR